MLLLQAKEDPEPLLWLCSRQGPLDQPSPPVTKDFYIFRGQSKHSLDSGVGISLSGFDMYFRWAHGFCVPGQDPDIDTYIYVFPTHCIFWRILSSFCVFFFSIYLIFSLGIPFFGIFKQQIQQNSWAMKSLQIHTLCYLWATSNALAGSCTGQRNFFEGFNAMA